MGQRALCIYKDKSGQKKNASHKNYDEIMGEICSGESEYFEKKPRQHDVVNKGPIIVFGNSDFGHDSPILSFVHFNDLNVSIPESSIVGNIISKCIFNHLNMEEMLNMNGKCGGKLHTLLSNKKCLQITRKKK